MEKRAIRLSTTLALAVLLQGMHTSCLCAGKDGKDSSSRSRTFLFTYEFAVTHLKPNSLARIWLPYPPTSRHQKVAVAFVKWPKGAKVTKGSEKKYGNAMWHIEAKADSVGVIRGQITYRIRRDEIRGLEEPITEANASLVYLSPASGIPTSGKPLELLKGMNLPKDRVKLGKLFYDLVIKHMKYAKPKGFPWGRGDAEWACTSGFGNCSDFHSLFMSLCRAHKLPAKFEIGFPLPEMRGNGEIGGYHCWAWFHADGKWLPVDISQADLNPKKADYFFGNLTEDRVTFSVGRDIDLVPKQRGPAIRFFVYPYVEVGGRAYDPAKVNTRFLYQDVDS